MLLQYVCQSLCLLSYSYENLKVKAIIPRDLEDFLEDDLLLMFKTSK